jgi:hypothetical protein
LGLNLQCHERVTDDLTHHASAVWISAADNT